MKLLVLFLVSLAFKVMNQMTLSYTFGADKRWPSKATQGQGQSRKVKAKTFKAKA